MAAILSNLKKSFWTTYLIGWVRQFVAMVNFFIEMKEFVS